MTDTQNNSKTQVVSKARTVEVMTHLFEGVDGQNMTIQDLAEGANAAEGLRTNVSENLFKLASTGNEGKPMGADQFSDMDKIVRKEMHWCKKPKDAKGDDYQPAPSTWKNAVSNINQAFKYKLNLKDFTSIYGTKGLNKELTAQREAAKSDKPKQEVEKQVQMAEVSPVFQALILEMIALDASIQTQKDADSLYDQVSALFNDAIDLSRLTLEVPQEATGIDLVQQEAEQLAKHLGQ